MGVIQKLESRVANPQRSFSSHVTLVQDLARSPRKIKCLFLWRLAHNYCCFLPSYLMSGDANAFLTKVIKNLEQKIILDPSSVDMWLSPVARSLSTVPLTSKNTAMVRSDMASSILDHALAPHPSNRMSRRLRLKYLRAGEKYGMKVNKAFTNARSHCFKPKRNCKFY